MNSWDTVLTGLTSVGVSDCDSISNYGTWDTSTTDRIINTWANSSNTITISTADLTPDWSYISGEVISDDKEYIGEYMGIPLYVPSGTSIDELKKRLFEDPLYSLEDMITDVEWATRVKQREKKLDPTPVLDFLKDVKIKED